MAVSQTAEGPYFCDTYNCIVQSEECPYCEATDHRKV